LRLQWVSSDLREQHSEDYVPELIRDYEEPAGLRLALFVRKGWLICI
jgi:hypothetical protein